MCFRPGRPRAAAAAASTPADETRQTSRASTVRGAAVLCVAYIFTSKSADTSNPRAVRPLTTQPPLPPPVLVRDVPELLRSMGNGRRPLLTEGVSASVTWLAFFLVSARGWVGCRTRLYCFFGLRKRGARGGACRVGACSRLPICWPQAGTRAGLICSLN